MGTFYTKGVEDIIKEVERVEGLTSPTAREMLMSGAEIVQECWRQAAEDAGLHDTGDMIKSIGYSREPKNLRDGMSIEIYPQGKDKKGIRNAEKAYLNHYGTGKRFIHVKKKERYVGKLEGTNFVEKAERLAGPRVQAEFERIWDERMKVRNGNG